MRMISVMAGLLLLVPGMLRAQHMAGHGFADVIRVQATSSVTRAPDQAVLRVAVETFAETAEEAAAENAERTEAVLDALEDAGIPDDRIGTANYSIRPEYEYERGRDGRDRQLVGYRVMNMIQVTINDLDRVGEIIDAVVEAGANRIDGLTFGLSNPEAARREALRNAVAEARADAEAIAAAAGVRLGRVVRITSGGGLVPPPRPATFDRAVVAEAAVTPIEPGELDVTASVTAVYAIEQP